MEKKNKNKKRTPLVVPSLIRKGKSYSNKNIIKDNTKLFEMLIFKNYSEQPLSINSVEFRQGEKYYLIACRHSPAVVHDDKKKEYVKFTNFDKAYKFRSKMDLIARAHRYSVTSIIVDDYTD